MRIEKKQRLRQVRRWRIHKKVIGTAARPRMSVTFSNLNIYVQFIDDSAGVTLAAVSTQSKTAPEREKLRANAVSAQKIGAFAAAAAKTKGITQVVFDRSGAQYHGKVKALADAARQAGLVF